MSCSVDIADHPDHPEGGYAAVLFRGAKLEASQVTLQIEPITEGFDYRGPRRINLEARQSDRGVELTIGPDIIGNLRQGLAVNVALAGTDLDSDVLWPMLTPPRAAPRRRAMQAAPSRRVVDVDGTKPVASFGTAPTAAPDSPKPSPSTPPTLPASPADTAPIAMDEPQEKKLTDLVGGEPAPSTVPKLLETAQIAKTSESLGGTSERKRGSAGVVGIAVAAFVMGAGATGLLWYLTPHPHPPTVTVADRTPLPSPFVLLDELPTRAPDGTLVRAEDGPSFRRRSERAATPPDASFWRRWAVRQLLTSKTNDAAAVLSNFAIDLATTGDAKSALPAARFVWELAAVGHDCTAMDNIATALDGDAEGHASTESVNWRRRADACHKQSATKD